MLEENGSRECTVASIADAIGVSPATIFKHFSSKTALFETAWYQLFCDQISSSAKKNKLVSADQNLVNTIHSLLKQWSKVILQTAPLNEKGLTKFVRQSQFYHQQEDVLQNVLRPILAHGIVSGEFKRTNASETSIIISRAFAALFDPIVIMSYNSEDVNFMRDALTELVLVWLRAPTPIAETKADSE